MTSQGGLGSTYRLQLNGLGFSAARALVPYVHELGIETLYLSPVLAAAPGSTHGYDVIDFTRLDPALGTAAEFEALLDELAAHDMRALLDIVPNHMAAQPSNPWWWDTLRLGQASADAGTFDIDWTQHCGKVLLPVLGRPLADADQEASVHEEADGPILELDGQRFPLAPDSAPRAPLLDLLAAQHFRPAFWRLGDTAGNYRRFFNIDGLVGVRVEDPEVFARTHGLILTLCADERVAGVRVDHIDGLWDPTGYLRHLTEALALRRSGRRAVLLVEKILDRDEALDAHWPVDGTTGYEFADRAGGLFLREEGCRELSALGATLTGQRATFDELGLAAKREMLERTFVAQLDRLARLALSALDTEHPGHDLSATDVRRALAELTTSLDVYRTFLDGGAPARADVATVARATARCPTERADREVERATTLLTTGLLASGDRASPWLAVAARWQQLTGAVMAKGVEDTATYRYNGLLSHAEVGCDPDRASCGAEEFHRFITGRSRRAGGGLNATSTHDSKRNEDARCRLAVLSEASAEWGRLVERWHRRFATTAPALSPHDELVVYQTLVSLWPTRRASLPAADVRRVQDYTLKAAREAKLHTSWTEPDSRYERSLRSFVQRICHEHRFQTEMGRFVHAIAPAAATNSLALTVLKACTPGVPDFYQGTELFEATLTDPDNRRPVDFSSRQAQLTSLPALDLPASELVPEVRKMLADWESGQIKLHVIRALLHLRRELPALFADGSYVPMETSGPEAAQLVTWSRRLGRQWVTAMIPRLTFEAAGRGRFPTGTRVWGETSCLLPKGAPQSYVDIFTGRQVGGQRGRLRAADAFGVLPVAVLRVADAP
jgi:(1->4)-alpha-D-glucan 1-alpha-D-glucosylmutase